MSNKTAIQPPLEDNTLISQIRAVSHTSGSINVGWSENHWTILLLFSNQTRTLRCNMRETARGEQETWIEWTSLNYQESRSQLRYWSFNTTNLSVKDFARYIYSNDLHQFISADNGSGCRHWIYTVLYSLGSTGRIQGDLSALHSALGWRYHKTSPPVQQPFVTGTFLKRPKKADNGYYYVNSATGAKDGNVVLYMLDVDGNRLTTLVDDWEESGNYLVLTIEDKIYYTDE